MDESASQRRLVVGLGNPGKRYADTRHNLGFMVVDATLAARGLEAGRWRFRGYVGEAVCGEHKVLFLKPQTFMNNSGRSVREAAAYYGIEPEQCLVICDCLDLALGKLRMRRKGSAGGHKGLRSVGDHLGTTDFPRLRIGIGPAPDDAIDYVLSAFGRDELPTIEQAVADASHAVDLWVGHGVEACMNEVNG